MSDQLIEVLRRGLRDSKESLQRAQKKLEEWQSEPSDPDYLAMEKQVKDCRAREQMYFKGLYRHIGNFD